uniref:Phage tail assembly chaperone-like domain-containing protein n=1 Tax=viral metagenome TaxID=1070528 RepID=A0A6C0E9Z9_9ZZZZ
MKHYALLYKGTTTIFLIYSFETVCDEFYLKLIETNNYDNMECVMPLNYNRISELVVDKIQDNKLYLKIDSVRQSNTIEKEWTKVREKRDNLLKDTDIFFLIDVNKRYTTASLNNMSNYRQSLRNIPDTFKNPFLVVWPVKPELKLK